MHHRAINMLEGVKAYQSYEHRREATPHKVIWEKANARLLDYGGSKNAPAIFCIPSLINRSHILDLYPERSFVRFLRDEGYRVLVLDWDVPSVRERRYDCSDYVFYLLLEALDTLRKKHKGPLHLLGYCMGGIFALAAAQLRAYDIDGLMLLATPWDFSGGPNLPGADWNAFEKHIMRQETIPPLWTETLFHLLDPWHFQDKFARFTHMKPAAQRHFAAVEQWVNDGVPLSRYVARECYIYWPRDNTLMNGGWEVGGEVIDPTSLTCPTFIATPTRDRIVPLSSSKPLTTLIPKAHSLNPNTGHVSMLVGNSARQSLWEPLSDWVNTHSE